MANDQRETLLELLGRFSYQQRDEAVFRLASGKMSKYYVDCRATTMRREARAALGNLAGLLPPDIRAVGGLTMGADPIAYAIAFHGDLDVFTVRKEPKKHGLSKWVEGTIEAGEKVAVVDDVVTTGGSTILAIQRCRSEGLQVGFVLILVDREEDDGLQMVKNEAGPDVPVHAVFKRSDLEDWLKKQG